MASEIEKEKYCTALATSRDIRCLVNDTFENAIKEDFSGDKTKLKDNLLKLEKKLRYENIEILIYMKSW